MKIAYADPPYPGCAHLYRNHLDYAGEVDHAALVERLERDFDGWVLHTNVAGLRMMERQHIKAARKPVVSKRLVMRDWIAEPITLRRGLTGVKPEAVCHWAFELLGARPEDDLCDLFPGTGAVGKAWETWRGKFALPATKQAEQCQIVTGSIYD